MMDKPGGKRSELDINFESLLKQGYAVIDVRYRDYEITDETFKYVIAPVEGDRDEFYPNMLRHYTKTEVKDKDVYEIWVAVLKHKLAMSDMLGRDVSIKVAAMDYLESR